METLFKMYEHMYWANEKILNALLTISSHQEVTRLFSHLLIAEKVWLTRLNGEDSSQFILWPEEDIKLCEELITYNKKNFTSFLSNIKSNHDLNQIVTYSNSKGTIYKNSIRDILTHVAMHGHYHRGQINVRLRIIGFEPVDIDYISFVRK